MIAEIGSFDIIWEAEQDEPPSLRFSEFMTQLFKRLRLECVQVAVLVTNDETIQTYNREYRGKDRPTDVLSFPASAHPGEGPKPLGDLIISMDRVLVQAEEIGQSPAQELRFLMLHGVLHLLGYDHEVDHGEMFALQDELKQQLKDFF